MIGWVVASIALVLCHVLFPFWGWVMVVPFVWGAIGARSTAGAIRGGASMGAIAWGGAAAIAWWRGADVVARRVAGLLEAWTGGDARSLLVATVVVGSIAAAVAATAGAVIRAVRPSPEEASD